MNIVCVSPARLLSAAQHALWPLETENNINIVKRIRLQNGVNGFEKPEKKVKTGIKWSCRKCTGTFSISVYSVAAPDHRDKLPFFGAEMPPDAKGIH